MEQPAKTTATQNGTSLAEVLCPIHHAWLEEANRYLVPVLNVSADFWTRWAAVRYLADGFRGWYRRETALVDRMSPSLRAGQVKELQLSATLLLQLRYEVDRIGRRRGTSPQVAEAARELLAHLTNWCAEIEAAATSLRADAYQAEVATLLAHLDARELHPVGKG